MKHIYIMTGLKCVLKLDAWAVQLNCLKWQLDCLICLFSP